MAKKKKKKTKEGSRRITELEESKGRSKNYYQLSASEQWDEDKRLGILDWDGN